MERDPIDALRAGAGGRRAPPLMKFKEPGGVGRGCELGPPPFASPTASCRAHHRGPESSVYAPHATATSRPTVAAPRFLFLPQRWAKAIQNEAFHAEDGAHEGVRQGGEVSPFGGISASRGAGCARSSD